MSNESQSQDDAGTSPGRATEWLLAHFPRSWVVLAVTFGYTVVLVAAFAITIGVCGGAIVVTVHVMGGAGAFVFWVAAIIIAGVMHAGYEAVDKELPPSRKRKSKDE